MGTIQVERRGQNIGLTFQDQNGQSSGVEIGLEEAKSLIFGLAKIGADIRHEPNATLLQQAPIAQARNPAYQIGITDEEDALFAFVIKPLPPFQIILDDDRAKALGQTMLEIVNTPRGMRWQKHRH